MQLTVLGCAGTFPGPSSPCSGYMVEHDGYRLLLDLGAGALGNLQRHCDLRDVDAIYITHLHADHCIDLVAYFYARRYHPKGMQPILPVYGPPGMANRIGLAFEEPPVDGLDDVYDFREPGPGTYQLGPFTVHAGVVNHPIECHGLRVEAGGKVLTYSGDTAACQEIVELARDADVFLCEASWPSVPTPPPGIHLTGREAGETATLAGAKRLLLTHLMPFHDPQAMLAEAKETYDGHIDLVSPGAVYSV
ncbi:MAG TPA: MBL fold metallo-hydrolase [Mycobacteriales bacterium]|nr:MBL fold metallo-hydrolase [Mycobacteriales bacterium]